MTNTSQQRCKTEPATYTQTPPLRNTVVRLGRTHNALTTAWTQQGTAKISYILWFRVTLLHHIIAEDLLAAYSCCESPIPPRAKGALMDSDMLTQEASELC